MIDTIAMRVRWKMKPAGDSSHPQRSVVKIWQKWEKKPGGVELPYIDRFEVSLPRLLYGHNGRLIDSQCELDKALECLRAELMDMAEVPPVSDWPIPQRIDLVWQWNIESLLGITVNSLILAHAELRHPMVRGFALKRDNSVTWEGKVRSLQLYDKSLKMRLGVGPILRAELRLKKGGPKSSLDRESWRNFNDLWRQFAVEMRRIPPINLPTKMKLCDLVAKYVRPDSQVEFLANLSTFKSKRTVWEYKRAFTKSKSGLTSSFNWSGFCPLEGPPLAVHVTKPHPSEATKSDANSGTGGCRCT